MSRGERASEAEEKGILVAMPGLWLLLLLVGPAAGLVLSTPSFPVSVSRGETALLPVSLKFSSSVPTYFQIRWRFITGPWLVLTVKADNCKGDNGTRQWWDACEITVAKAERYTHRAEWSSEAASLILRDARVEDSGIYDIKVLALGVRVSANINLTVINAPPVSLKTEFGRHYMVPNIIRLSLAGLILCLLGFIIAENVTSSYSRRREARVPQMEIPFSSSSSVEQCFLICEKHPS